MALSITGCANDGSSLFITASGGSGRHVPRRRRPWPLNGVVDVTLTDNLVIFPVFASQLRDRVSPNASNPSDMHVRWVDVRLEDLGGNTLDLGLPNPFRVPYQRVHRGLHGLRRRVHRAPAPCRCCRRATPTRSAAPGGNVLAALRPIGRTNGGLEVEGNYDFHYQIMCMRKRAGDEFLLVTLRHGGRGAGDADAHRGRTTSRSSACP
jgi:hypothetical protein